MIHGLPEARALAGSTIIGDHPAGPRQTVHDWVLPTPTPCSSSRSQRGSPRLTAAVSSTSPGSGSEAGGRREQVKPGDLGRLEQMLGQRAGARQSGPDEAAAACDRSGVALDPIHARESPAVPGSRADARADWAGEQPGSSRRKSRAIRTRPVGHREDYSGSSTVPADRIGGPAETPAEPIPDERARTTMLQSLEHVVAESTRSTCRGRPKPHALIPALQIATELLRTGRATEAVAHLERIVAAMRSMRQREGRSLRPASRSRPSGAGGSAAGRLQEARAALDRRPAHALCFALLEQAGELSAGPDRLPRRSRPSGGPRRRVRATKSGPAADRAGARPDRRRRAAWPRAWAAPQHAPADPE